MATTPQFIKAAEGFDIYPAGALTNNYPWSSVNSVNQTIAASTGAFGGNALSFTTGTNLFLADYSFPGTGQPRNAQGTSGVVTWSGWVNIGTPVAQATAQVLVGLGSLSSPGSSGNVLGLLGLSFSTAAGLSLVFPTTLNALATSPFSFAITANTYYWVTVTIAFAQALPPKAIYTINGNIVFNANLAYTADLFAAGALANTIKLARTAIGPWLLDDMVVQSVSDADSNWPGNPYNPLYTPQLQPRRISNGVAVGNGPTVQMTPSVSVPNFQAATDPTGGEFVTATDIAQTDLYKWTGTGVTDVSAIVYKGTSNRWTNVVPQQSVGGVQTPLPLVTSASARFIGITENDGTNKWTATSIAAGFFGQESQ